jgi:kumamolisin
MQRYGADPADISRIVAFAREHGLQVISENAETRTVQLAGTVVNMNSAFGVNLFKAIIAGREFRYREGPVTLPRSIAQVVTAVLNLDDMPVASPRAEITPATAATARCS